MIQIFEEEISGGRLTCRLEQGNVCVTACQGTGQYVEIPDRIHELPVAEIGKKAFLGDKNMKELVLPGTILEIGDWAFAHCSRLERVWIPRKEIRFGKGAFKDCKRLSQIAFMGQQESGEGRKLSGLLAMAPVMLEAEYLLAPMEAGDEVWLSKLDARLITLLERPDREGYSRQVLCGEEDLMASLDLYLEERRKQKARLCYHRLFHDYELKEELREALETYLRENTKGCGDEAAWKVLLDEHGGRREYYQIFAHAGCITEDNFQALLGDMGERFPEMKAWLIRYQAEHGRQEDFFAGLSLD